MEIGSCGQKIQYEKREDGICVTGCGGEESAIAIPETIEGIKVTSVGAYAFAQRQEVREIQLPDGVREIGRYAFYRCVRGLKSFPRRETYRRLGEKMKVLTAD